MATNHNNAGRIRVGWLVEPKAMRKLGLVLRPLLPHLSECGVDVVLLCKGKIDLTKNPMANWGVEICPCGNPTSLFHRQYAMDNFVQCVKAARVDVLHAMDDHSAKLTSKIAAQLDLPFIVNCDTPKSGHRAWRNDPNLSAVIAAGQNILANLLKRKIVTEKKLHILRYGIEPVSKAKKLQLADKCITILADGTGAKRTALETMLTAFSDLLKQQYDCSLFIIAPEHSERALRQKSEKLKIQSQTNFVSVLPEKNIASVIQDADIFIALSPADDSNVHAILAMANGVPMLAASDSKADCIVADDTAILFSTADPAGLHKHLAEMLDDPEKPHKLAATALYHVAQNHDATHHAERLTALYREATKVVVVDESASE